jgi:hypothetical protein
MRPGETSIRPGYIEMGELGTSVPEHEGTAHAIEASRGTEISNSPGESYITWC